MRYSCIINHLTHWGRVTHICVGKLTIIDSDNGLSPERRQAIIWINAGILLIGPLGRNFSEILIKIQSFSLKKIRLKMSSAKCCSFRLGLNVFNFIMTGVRCRLCFHQLPCTHECGSIDFDFIDHFWVYVHIYIWYAEFTGSPKNLKYGYLEYFKNFRILETGNGIWYRWLSARL